MQGSSYIAEGNENNLLSKCLLNIEGLHFGEKSLTIILQNNNNNLTKISHKHQWGEGPLLIACELLKCKAATTNVFIITGYMKLCHAGIFFEDTKSVAICFTNIYSEK